MTIQQSDQTQTLTINQFAEQLGVEYAVAAGVMKFLRLKNIARPTGEEVPNPRGKGRGSDIYVLPVSFTVAA